jgi:glycosyltransferase involved in cell wall biosynthesis
VKTNNTTKKPKISVVMPVYNCAQYLEEALASLLIQTFDDFEILAINDGSTDDSLKILEKYAKIDSRLKILSQKNSGIVKALNRGIKESRADYIARMDGDDISFPNRFTDQVKILDADPEVVLVAGNFEVIDQASEFLYRGLVVPDNDYLQRAFYLRNAIAHGSVMFRKSVVQRIGGYSDKCGPTEDLELWMRLLKEGDFAATDSPVYKWRMNQGGLTLSNNAESIRQSQLHIEKRWQEGQPKYLSRDEIIKRANYYCTNYKKYGAHYKNLLLIDTSQIAVKLIAHGHKLEGIKQLVAVASTGRMGLKFVMERIHLVIQGQYNNIKEHVQ